MTWRFLLKSQGPAESGSRKRLAKDASKGHGEPASERFKFAKRQKARAFRGFPLCVRATPKLNQKSLFMARGALGDGGMGENSQPLLWNRDQKIGKFYE
ncbi:hypothetical protein D9M70_613270 [compost metagenome]